MQGKGFFGLAAYFASRAEYSHEHFAFPVGNGMRCLVLAKVLLGRTYRFGLTVNPRTRALVNAPAGFHSVCGGPHKSSRDSSMVYAVYRPEQVYPEYVVTYGTFSQLTRSLPPAITKEQAFRTCARCCCC